MGYPIAPTEGFYRTPAGYPHDAFAVDTGGRVRPHSGGDSTPFWGVQASARAVVAGTVSRCGWTIYAGHYVVVRDAFGRLWLTIHLASRAVQPDDVVVEGARLGVVGNTGGGGALAGKSSLATHCHTSLCIDDAAVDRIINGLVRARYKGETGQQWATAHGLLDPWPIIRDGVKSSAPAESAEQTDTYREAREMATLPTRLAPRLWMLPNGTPNYVTQQQDDALRNFVTRYDFEKGLPHPDDQWVAGTIVMLSWQAVEDVRKGDISAFTKALEQAPGIDAEIAQR